MNFLLATVYLTTCFVISLQATTYKCNNLLKERARIGELLSEAVGSKAVYKCMPECIMKKLREENENYLIPTQMQVRFEPSKNTLDLDMYCTITPHNPHVTEDDLDVLRTIFVKSKQN